MATVTEEQIHRIQTDEAYALAVLQDITRREERLGKLERRIAELAGAHTAPPEHRQPGRRGRGERGTMAERVTNQQIAESYELWLEYHDPNGEVSREEFEEMTIEERLESIRAAHGMDDEDEW